MSLPRGIQTFITFLLIAYPSFALVHGSGASATLHVVAAVGLVWMVQCARYAGGRRYLSTFWREYGLLCLAMLSPLVVNIISHGYSGELGEAFSTTAQRAAFGVLVLHLLLHTERRRLAHVQWGVLVGALVAALVLSISSGGGVVRPTPAAQNLLNYANFVALLGVFALYMLRWHLTRFAQTEALMKVLAFALAVYALYLAESRGPLLSFGLLIALFVVFGVPVVALRWRLALCTLALVGVGVSIMQSDRLVDRMHQSVEATVQSLPALINGDAPTGGDASTRIRFGLWYASWLMFKEHPWIGDGSRSFSERLEDLNEKGLVNDETTWRPGGAGPFVQPHNEIANAIATQGLAGLLSLMLLYAVPLYYFVRQRAHTDVFGCVAADMGIATCVGVMLFGLTVTVFTSGWMMVHYVLLVSLFVALSRPVRSEKDAMHRPLTRDGRVLFPPRWQQKFLRRVVRLFRGKAHRHDAHLWPYVKITRGSDGRINRLLVQGHEVPLISMQDAFVAFDEEVHIILSGPSVAKIDYSELPPLQAMGVNGSILLQDKADIEFPYYCLIDRTFVRDRTEVVKRIVSEDRILFAAPDIVRYIYEFIPAHEIRCRICLVEGISEPAYKPKCTPESLRAMQSAGHDVVVFDEAVPLGFSFDPAVGWFDADTVAYTALQVAVWGGATRVYLHGLDINSAPSGQRFYNEGAKPLPTRLERNFATLIEPSFRQAVRQLQQRGIQVFNLSPVSKVPVNTR